MCFFVLMHMCVHTLRKAFQDSWCPALLLCLHGIYLCGRYKDDSSAVQS